MRKLLSVQSQDFNANAELTSTLAMFPLETIRTRLAVDPKKYRNMLGAFQTIVEAEGASALYRVRCRPRSIVSHHCNGCDGIPRAADLLWSLPTLHAQPKSSCLDWWAQCLKKDAINCKSVHPSVQGLKASLLGAIPYSAVRLGSYDGLKWAYKRVGSHNFALASLHPSL